MIGPLPNPQFDSLDCLQQALHRTQAQRKREDGDRLGRAVSDTNGNAPLNILVKKDHAAEPQMLFGGYTE
jgi:hypothetical protein